MVAMSVDWSVHPWVAALENWSAKKLGDWLVQLLEHLLVAMSEDWSVHLWVATLVHWLVAMSGNWSVDSLVHL